MQHPGATERALALGALPVDDAGIETGGGPDCGRISPFALVAGGSVQTPHLHSSLRIVRHVPAGEGISYGNRYL